MASRGSATLSAAELAHVSRLEEAMWRDETRWDVDWMDAPITPDFVEFGASGRSFRLRTLSPQ